MYAETSQSSIQTTRMVNISEKINALEMIYPYMGGFEKPKLEKNRTKNQTEIEEIRPRERKIPTESDKSRFRLQGFGNQAQYKT